MIATLLFQHARPGRWIEPAEGEDDRAEARIKTDNVKAGSWLSCRRVGDWQASRRA
ncbi:MULTISPECIES: hypothetical protein [unclassified Microbacterium]|jgi:hypothetical protein|uniref:hypothetical protein n=1 Tax=unclassified Microbacterium TaxID=2609290 RepID=UPI000A9F268B|nr:MULTISPECIES: hypothetical protein [unclassified Microbacterium]